MMVTIDTQLREAAEAVRQARREADLAAGPPTPPTGARGPLIAALTALAALFMFGLPALLTVGPDQSLTPPTDVSTESSGSEAPDTTNDDGEVPILLLDTPDWQPTRAHNVVNPETGAVIAREVVYENESGTVWLTVHKTSFEQSPASETLETAGSSESILIDGRDVALHTIDHKQLDGPGLETHALQWSDGDFGVIVIGWGLDRSTTLALYESIQNIGQAEWDMIQASIGGVTPTTIAPQEPESGS